MTGKSRRVSAIRQHGPACFYCGLRESQLASRRPDLKAFGARTTSLVADHLVPLARGGSDDPSNLVPACTPCNSMKGARSVAELRSYIEWRIWSKNTGARPFDASQMDVLAAFNVTKESLGVQPILFFFETGAVCDGLVEIGDAYGGRMLISPTMEIQ